MKKRKPIVLNANHHQIIDFVKDFNSKNSRDPFMYEICYGLDRTSKAISKALTNAIPDYPEKLMVSPIQYERSLKFEAGMSINDLAAACGVNKESIYTRKDEFELLGITFRMERGKYNKNPHKLDKRYAHDRTEKGEYITVTHGKFKGATGYLEPFTDVANAVLWINGEQVPARLETCEYREYRRKYEAK